MHRIFGVTKMLAPSTSIPPSPSVKPSSQITSFPSDSCLPQPNTQFLESCVLSFYFIFHPFPFLHLCSISPLVLSDIISLYLRRVYRASTFAQWCCWYFCYPRGNLRLFPLSTTSKMLPPHTHTKTTKIK